MSSFGDEQLNYMAQTLEEIEVYMGRISRAMEELVKLQISQHKHLYGEWPNKEGQ